MKTAMTCVDPSSVWSCGLDVPFRCQRSDARSLTTGDSSGAGVSTRVQMTPFGLEFSPRSCDRALKALSDPVCHQTSQTTCVWPQGRVGVWAPVLRGFIDPRGPRVCAPRVWAPLSVLTSALSPACWVESDLVSLEPPRTWFFFIFLFFIAI